MDIVVAMVLGCIVGATVFPDRLRGLNSILQLATTTLLIFSMGVMLGARENFLGELASVGFDSVVFCLLPTACSVAVVYPLTRVFMKQHLEDATRDAKRAEAQANGGPGESALIACAVGALLFGVCYGLSPLQLAPVDWLAESSDAILDALVFFVGISVGASKGILSKVRSYHVKALVIPFGIVVGSLVGGLAASVLCGYQPAVGCAVAGGLGWYSLSGVMLTDLVGAQVGSVTFLSNLLRELVSFFSIPFIARRLNFLTCIAPAGATSEDTTLPMLVKCTNEETVVLAVVNGVVCSAVVPVLIGLLQPLF